MPRAEPVPGSLPCASIIVGNLVNPVANTSLGQISLWLWAGECGLHASSLSESLLSRLLSSSLILLVHGLGFTDTLVFDSTAHLTREIFLDSLRLSFLM